MHISDLSRMAARADYSTGNYLITQLVSIEELSEIRCIANVSSMA